PSLPQAITLPHKEGAPEYTRPGQFGARLGLEYDPVFVEGSRENPLGFSAPAVSLRGDVGVDRLLARRGLLAALDDAQRLAPPPATTASSRARRSPCSCPARRKPPSTCAPSRRRSAHATGRASTP